MTPQKGDVRCQTQMEITRTFVDRNDGAHLLYGDCDREGTEGGVCSRISGKGISS